MLRNLRAEMARNGVTIGDIATFLGVRYATVSDKVNGRFRFYYDEAARIKNKFFHGCDIEYLFAYDDIEDQPKEANCTYVGHP